MTDAARAHPRSFQHFAEFCSAVHDAGAERKILDESTATDADVTRYVRIVELGASGALFQVSVAIDHSQKIADLYVRPTTPAKDVIDETKTPLRLPFDGQWYVAAGGRTLQQNHHVNGWDIRFAYEFVATEDATERRRTENADYASWGRNVLAPAEGVVQEVVDTRPDHEPGRPQPGDAYGNHVVIDHGNGEYSYLLHLRGDSVRGRVGQRVRAGDVMGLCGDSGDSTGPHLYYHLQDRLGPQGKGLPAQFRGYLADGTPVVIGEPIQGMRVSNSSIAVPRDAGRGILRDR